MPIRVGGRLWGVAIVASARKASLPAGTEERLTGFTELVGTAIANAEAQDALAASRARIVTAADEARRLIERDLHDGAQQRLVTLALQLREIQAMAPPEAGDLVKRLDGVAAGLEAALEELREIARGIHPAVLAQGGLRPALAALARRSAVPVDLRVQVADRLPGPAEIAAYYVVSEALTNTARHAGATAASVDVTAGEGVLRVRVRDDGRGGADFGQGSGLVGLRDRVEALGGRLALEDSPGEGTTLEVRIPIAGGSVRGVLTGSNWPMTGPAQARRWCCCTAGPATARTTGPLSRSFAGARSSRRTCGASAPPASTSPIPRPSTTRRPRRAAWPR